MKKEIRIATISLLLAASVLESEAKREKRNLPKIDVVKSALQSAGGEHFPSSMKISKVGSLEAGESYYHIFCGELSSGKFHAIIFDNQNQYLGYYLTILEPDDTDENIIHLVDKENDNPGAQRIIPIGNFGPFKEFEAYGSKVYKFTPSPANESTEKGYEKYQYKEWEYTPSNNDDLKKNIQAKFMMYDGKYLLFLKDKSDGVVRLYRLEYLSKKDQSFIKKIAR